MSKKRKNTKRNNTTVQLEKNFSTDGRTCGACHTPHTQPMKQTGIAAISSRTTDEGSFCFSIFSPSPHNQTDKASPTIVPPTKIQKLPDAISSAVQPRPTTDPKVPGPKGIRPAPNPCAIHSFRLNIRVRIQASGDWILDTGYWTLNPASQILQIKPSVLPQVDNAGNKRQ